jgi:hypothetical protein
MYYTPRFFFHPLTQKKTNGQDELLDNPGKKNPLKKQLK